MSRPATKNTFYSREEVEKHNKDGDLWLIIDCLVYDVSSWIKKHPGKCIWKFACLCGKAGDYIFAIATLLLVTNVFLLYNVEYKSFFLPYFRW